MYCIRSAAAFVKQLQVQWCLWDADVCVLPHQRLSWFFQLINEAAANAAVALVSDTKPNFWSH